MVFAIVIGGCLLLAGVVYAIYVVVVKGVCFVLFLFFLTVCVNVLEARECVNRGDDYTILFDFGRAERSSRGVGGSKNSALRRFVCARSKSYVHVMFVFACERGKSARKAEGNGQRQRNRSILANKREKVTWREDERRTQGNSCR